MYKHPLGRLIIFSALFLAGALGYAVTEAPPASEAPLPPAGITLEECYQRAIKVSETLQIDDQDILQLEAIYRQGVGGVLPHVSWDMSQYWQDTTGVQQSSGGVQGTLLRKRRPESYFQLTQPLFHGLRDFNAIRGFKAAKKGAEFNRDQAALDMLTDVAEVFYTSLDLEQELEVLANQRQLTADRLKELERRVRLGKSRDSEVLSSEVELASLDAQLEDSHQRWSIARRVLEFLTEVPPATPLREDRPLPTLPALQDAHNQSASRPDIQAARQTQLQEQYRVSYARGGYLPGLDLTARYYTERVGYNENVNWDALVNLDVPIFTGFITKAEVQEAKTRQIVADLEYARLKRLIYRDIETAHANLRYTVTQVQHYSKAVDLAQKNYKIQQDEYRLGLINNLQVLDVLNDLQDLKIRRLRSEASMRINDVRLRVAMGKGL